MSERVSAWNKKENNYIKPILKIGKKIKMNGMKYIILEIRDKFVVCESNLGFKESFLYYDVWESLQNKEEKK